MVKMLLGFSCVRTDIRNKEGQLPEDCATSRHRYFKKQLDKHRKLAMSKSASLSGSDSGRPASKLGLPTPPTTRQDETTHSYPTEEATPTPSVENGAAAAGSDSPDHEQFTMSMFDDEMKRLKAELAKKLAS